MFKRIFFYVSGACNFITYVNGVTLSGLRVTVDKRYFGNKEKTLIVFQYKDKDGKFEVKLGESKATKLSLNELVDFIEKNKNNFVGTNTYNNISLKMAQEECGFKIQNNRNIDVTVSNEGKDKDNKVVRVMKKCENDLIINNPGTKLIEVKDGETVVILKISYSSNEEEDNKQKKEPTKKDKPCCC